MTLTVLIIDDDPEWLDRISRLVEKLGHEVATASSGYEAINEIETHNKFDAVITDTRMDGGDGIDVLKFLYFNYSAGVRPRTYIHSSDDVHWHNGERLELKKYVPEQFPGTNFNGKIRVSEGVREFLGQEL